MAQRTPDRVVIINDRSAMVGGASNLAILSAKLFSQQGLNVTYLCGDQPETDLPVPDTIGLAGKPLVQQGKLSAFASGLYNAKAFAALDQLIREKDTPSTIYHVHGWSKILSPSIFRALSGVRQRTILHAHDYFLACPNGGFTNYRTDHICQLRPMSAQCVMSQCDKRGYQQKLWRTARHLLREHFYAIQNMPANIVVVHERMRTRFEQSGMNTDRVVTIRNPVEPFFRIPKDPSEHNTFFFIGRLEPEKGFEEAARAARMANVKLEVIGDGPGRAVLERGYPEVVIHGWQSREGLRQIMQRARALVISSRVPEPFSLAALEAVSSGIPVIIPDSALLSTEIAQLGCGFAFAHGNLEALAARLRQMAGDDVLIRRFADNCRDHAPALASTHASWIEALLVLYGDVLDRASDMTQQGAFPSGPLPGLDVGDVASQRL
ncbi:glycosyltransferase family 4 protein [Rhizobium sp. SL42]|uniref:glycosyltransferase family 4 protein n=1 Tax=Rhizobium sp. SL42 TaxID=2806346 RepID=UPI001F1F921E|nr:glycosyltransferase family 4 protein [Rhizobium sp. SL42]UJW77395.1 glycosyltransferase family 4 protein [Rhizobium sp. SL42]